MCTVLGLRVQNVPDRSSRSGPGGACNGDVYGESGFCAGPVAALGSRRQIGRAGLISPGKGGRRRSPQRGDALFALIVFR